MIATLPAAAVALMHTNGVPHVHPHEAILIVGLLLAVVGLGAAALVKRRRSAS